MKENTAKKFSIFSYINKKIKIYMKLSKMSIVMLITITTALGYYMSIGTVENYWHFTITLVATALVCAGSCCFNQVFEHKKDKKMKRTRNRPIPKGEISVGHAAFLATSMSIKGLGLMWVYISPLMALGGLVTSLLYLALYTPLKTTTYWNTLIGAIPGALPILGGWMAASNSLNVSAWILFSLMFFWQLPHFYAIAWKYRTDYLRGNFKMLSNGNVIKNQVVLFTILTVVSSLVLMFFIDSLSLLYLFGAVLLGGIFIYVASKVLESNQMDFSGARKVIKASILYLPLLFLFVIIDSLLSI